MQPIRDNVWVDASDAPHQERRKLVRAHAARASAAARRATMIKKKGWQAKQPGIDVFALAPATASGITIQPSLRSSPPRPPYCGAGGDDEFPTLVDVVATILNRYPILRGETSLAHGHYRNML
jgi:hypothetical protein